MMVGWSYSPIPSFDHGSHLSTWLLQLLHAPLRSMNDGCERSPGRCLSGCPDWCTGESSSHPLPSNWHWGWIKTIYDKWQIWINIHSPTILVKIQGGFWPTATAFLFMCIFEYLFHMLRATCKQVQSQRNHHDCLRRDLYAPQHLAESLKPVKAFCQCEILLPQPCSKQWQPQCHQRHWKKERNFPISHGDPWIWLWIWARKKRTSWMTSVAHWREAKSVHWWVLPAQARPRCWMCWAGRVRSRGKVLVNGNILLDGLPVAWSCWTWSLMNFGIFPKVNPGNGTPAEKYNTLW